MAENRNGLIAAAMATQATGKAEREAGELMVAGSVKRRNKCGRITPGADKACDTRDFVDTVRAIRSDTALHAEQYEPAQRN